MFFTYFTARNGLGRALAARLLMGGILLVLMGLFVLVFPIVVASIVAVLCFLGASALLSGAWRVYRASRPLPSMRSEAERFEEAVWREIR